MQQKRPSQSSRAGLRNANKLRRRRTDRKRTTRLESLESRWVLTASFPGNANPPDLDLSAVEEQQIVVGQTYTIDLMANGATVVDLDENGNPTGDQIRLILDPDIGTDTPVGATITADGVFSWTPTADQVGTHRIVVIAVDRGAPPLADAEIFTIVVTAEGNQAPIVDLNGPGAGTGYNGTFTEDGGPVPAVGENLTVTDGDNENLESARVVLTNRPDGDVESLAVDTGGTGIVATYNPETGELLLEGTASVAEYQQVLRTLTYNNTSQDPDTANRIIQVTVNDGTTNSPVAVSTIAVVAVNDAPVVDLNGDEEGVDYEATFNEGEGPVVIVSEELTIDDVDNDQLASATVTITNLLDGAAESLSVDTSGTGITAQYDAETGVLTLTGNASLAEYQQVLRTLAYDNTQENPDETARIIEVVVSDGTDDSAVATTTVTIVGINDSPDLEPIEDQVATVGQPMQIVVTATDPDGDELTFLLDRDNPEANIPASATITKTSDTTAVIEWTPSAEDGPGPFHFVVLVVDDHPTEPLADQESFTVTLTAGSEAPVLDLNGDEEGIDFEGSFIEDGGPVAAVGAELTITDVDSDELASATVVLTNRPNGEDEILAVDTGETGITATYDPETGILTLTGVASLEDYQQVLSTLTYDNLSQDPDVSDRVIELTVNDGDNDSVTATSTISVEAVNDLPTVDLNGEEEGIDYETTFTEDGGAVAIVGPELTIEDVDNDTLSSATVTITNLLDGDAEVLSVETGDSGITASYDAETGVLTLSGEASLAAYEQVLRSLSYDNTSQNPDETPRVIEVVVNDGEGDSAPAVSTVTIVGVNDSPQLEPIEDQVATIGETMQVVVTATDPDGDELTFQLDRDNPGANIPESATITKTGPNTAVIEWTPTAEDGEGPFVFTVLVTDDHSETPLADQESFTVTLGNPPPTVDLNGEDEGTDFSTTFFEGEGAVTIVDTGLTVDDDGTTLASATIVITNLLDGDAEELTVVTGETDITASYDSETGTLELTGVDTLENYEQVLRTLAYNNSSQNPSDDDRVITVTVNDGTSSSAAAVATIVIETFNDSPDLVLPSPYDDWETPVDVNVGEEVSFTVSVFDPDDFGDNLTIILDLDGSGIPLEVPPPTITPDGQFSWTPTQTGVFTITILVIDSASNADQETFILNVVDDSEPPLEGEPLSDDDFDLALNELLEEGLL